ncbi:DUF2157 domain-containing protein [Chitinophaga vietnamensis]|uniref:DUF2157 domain-containing protein n=1 Tax=Chitinophaga vietnamensis TaxID=2593957 RepID=UPI0011788962|nr:DUF2157 domain-containing protein [Chitinophaga vietnamensis]
MDIHLFEKLRRAQVISDASLEKVKAVEKNRLFSLHWEIKTLLYLGVLLLSGGLGILVYKHIDTIGHQAILALIAAISTACFAYCFRKARPFSWQKVASPNSFFDYALLLGCLTLITFIGYLQVQYTAFGNAYGLATFIPLAVLAFSAYYFDHLGVLSMAVVNLAAWVGVAIRPLELLHTWQFSAPVTIYTGAALGVFLLLAGELTQRKNLKAHFAFTYHNFGTHIFFLACLAGMVQLDAIWVLLLAAMAAYVYQRAARERSFYFILITILYAYVGLSYLVLRSLDHMKDLDAIYLGLFYFLFSALGVVLLLVHLNKKLRQ